MADRPVPIIGGFNAHRAALELAEIGSRHTWGEPDVWACDFCGVLRRTVLDLIAHHDTCTEIARPASGQP